MINQDFADTLKNFIEDSLDNIVIPFQDNKQIRIKNFLIRQTRSGYIVIDLTKNQQTAFTNFKKSAVAIAKSLVEGKNKTNQLLRLDKIMFKNYNDAVFYKNIIKKTKDQVIRDSRQARLDVAIDQATHAKKNIEDFIF